MGKWSRAELEEAFENYQRLALEAGTSGNWDAWSDQFTEDATYTSFVGTHYRGRADIAASHAALFGKFLKGTKLFDEIAPKYADRSSGYTRIVKIGARKGDAAPIVQLELV